jgi:hypothetical protein
MFSDEFWNNPGSTQVLTQKAIFFGGFTSSGYNSITGVTNLVSDEGVVASDTTAVATARRHSAGSGYGEDKAIFGFGLLSDANATAITNLVSNEGVVASDTAGVGTTRQGSRGSTYGGDKAIFAFGTTSSSGANDTAISNLVSNSGVVASDTAGVGTARYELAAAAYGEDKAIFGFGLSGGGNTFSALTNLVSNEGVVASDTAGVGGARFHLAAAGYGEDKAIFGFGIITPGNANTAITNLVSNSGVVASDTAGVGAVRLLLAAAVYGGDKAIFGFGRTGTSGTASVTAISSLVSNSGVVASDTAGVGTARGALAAAGYAN